jgi:hypothetical protein
VSDDNTQDTPVTDRTSASGFKRAVGNLVDPADDENTGEQSGFVHQQKQAARAQQEDEDSKNASGFFQNAAGGDSESGFSLAGIDSNGSGFNLGPAATAAMFGGKWMFIHPDAVMTDNHTMHPQFQRGLNRSFDKMIRHAIDQKWKGIILQQGLAGRVAATGPLTRALNRRIEFLANPPPEKEKYARRIIRGMGFDPDHPEVKAQLQSLRAHAMSPEEMLRMTNNPPVPSTPAPNGSPTAPTPNPNP